MHELGIETSILQDILAGRKTVEGRLGKPEYLKLRAGDKLSLREDVWKDGRVIRQIPNRSTIQIKQILYFNSFEEMLRAVGFKSAIPRAKDLSDAISVYGKFYSPQDEQEFGVMALLFEVK